ncbi:phage tail-fiber protein [Pasteurella multocida subsp. multocida OH4807]|nr:phage tail-fiber protein [Pasteurella multocida subsp. multocida OH4807]
MADFNKPTVDSHYTQFPNEIRAAISAALSFLDGGSHINIPMKAKRWNPTSKIFEEYSGTQWVPMANEYKLPVDYNVLLNKPVPSSSTNSNSETTFANSKAVKIVHDLANSKQNPATTLAGYGITNFKIETANGNANNYKTDGNYYFASGQNLPSAGAWHIEVVSGGAANAIRQIARKANDSEVKERFFNGSSWSEWKKTGSDGLPVGSIVAFPKNITPTGFLRANGTTFNQATYPDLYAVNGNSNRLPNLTRSDVGMTAYFTTDAIPDGWIAFDSIRTTVTQQKYPELYQHLVAKYGSISNVPLAEDRFIRNAGNGLNVGQTQNDEIKKHVHRVGTHWIGSDDNRYFFNLSEAIYDSRLRTAPTSDSSLDDNGFMLPLLSSPMATGGIETRPKSIILKLCVKAKDKFNDVVFWIKAFGEIVNTGTLDAGTLAQELQNKSNINHTHNVSDILDFNQIVIDLINQNNGFTQNLEQNGWVRLPSGFIVQWGYANCNYDTIQTISFNITFVNKCIGIVFGQTGQNGNHLQIGNYSGRVGEISYGNVTKTNFKLANDGASCRVFWVAVGN